MLLIFHRIQYEGRIGSRNCSNLFRFFLCCCYCTAPGSLFLTVWCFVSRTWKSYFGDSYVDMILNIILTVIVWLYPIRLPVIKAVHEEARFIKKKKNTFTFVKVLFFLAKCKPITYDDKQWLFLCLFLYISRMKNVAAEYMNREPVAEPPHKPLCIYFCLVKWEVFERLWNPPTAFPLSVSPSHAQTTRAAGG